MAFLFPALPDGSFKFTYVSNRKEQRPTSGGSTQVINSLGDRFRMETTFKVRAGQGVGLNAQINANLGQKVRVPVPQPFDIGTPGEAVQVNGSNAGRTLRVKGLPAGYEFKNGQFVTVVKGAKRYLHQVVGDLSANGAGQASLAITPMLRTPLAGNETVEVANPTIEGFLTNRENPWVLGFVGSVEMTVSVEEAE